MNKLIENPNVKYIFDQFRNHGYQIYIVGGAVRDYLLNQKIGDIDFTTNARPEEIKELFNHTVDIGKEFGTIKVNVNNHFYEITTFRKESDYEDKRHPRNLEFSENLLDDLSRRDLTINGLVMTEDGKVLDYVNGLKDIENGMIRCIGNPEERFKEDELRKWRAIRLASEKGFEFEKDTYNSLSYDPYTDNISIERIREELNRIICSDKVNWGGYHLVRTRLYQLLLKRLGLQGFLDRLDLMEDLIEPFEVIYHMQPDLCSRLAMLLKPMNQKEAIRFLVEMKYSKTIVIKVLNYKLAMNITKGATC